MIQEVVKKIMGTASSTVIIKFDIGTSCSNDNDNLTMQVIMILIMQTFLVR